MDQPGDRSRRVLIVEDHAPTARLFVEAFEGAAPGVSCVDVRTGEMALEHLTGECAATREPGLVLLDLDLPGMDGFEVLEKLYSHPELRGTPVVVVSGNTSSEAVERCYELRARTFIPKPDDWDEFTALAESIARYWFETADRPTGGRPHATVDAGVEVE